MSEEVKKSFLIWLSEQVYRTDNTGNFARSIIGTANIPKTSKYLDWFKFIKGNDSEFTVGILTSIWVEYINSGNKKEC